jgi:proteasome accessory factor B
MLAIHELLRANRFPNSPNLSARLEVTPRTIYRDIEFMRCRLRLPIDYDIHRAGYFYSTRVDQFPGVSVSESELFALAVARKAVAQYQGTPFEKPLSAAYRKLASGLGQDRSLHLEDPAHLLEFRPMGADEVDAELFETLCRATRLCRVTKFLYRKIGAKKPERRCVNPYQLACIDSRWYVFAFDQARRAIRSFVLSRMSDLEILDSSFERPAGWTVAKHLKNSFGVFKDDAAGDYEVVLEFDAWAADVLRGRKWHSTQQVAELPEGRIRMTFRLGNLEEIERWVLSWGGHATVLRPKRLVQRIQRTIHQLARRYGAAAAGTEP